MKWILWLLFLLVPGGPPAGDEMGARPVSDACVCTCAGVAGWECNGTIYPRPVNGCKTIPEDPGLCN